MLSETGNRLIELRGELGWKIYREEESPESRLSCFILNKTLYFLVSTLFLFVILPYLKFLKRSHTVGVQRTPCLYIFAPKPGANGVEKVEVHSRHIKLQKFPAEMAKTTKSLLRQNAVSNQCRTSVLLRLDGTKTGISRAMLGPNIRANSQLPCMGVWCFCFQFDAIIKVCVWYFQVYFNLAGLGHNISILSFDGTGHVTFRPCLQHFYDVYYGSVINNDLSASLP